MILYKSIFVFLIFLFLDANSQEKSFNLKQSIDKVLRNHKTILATKTDIEAAKFRIKQSKGGYFPSLDVTANYGHENIIKYGPGNNTQLAARDATAKITQTLSDFGLTSDESLARIIVGKVKENGEQYLNCDVLKILMEATPFKTGPLVEVVDEDPPAATNSGDCHTRIIESEGLVGRLLQLST